MEKGSWGWDPELCSYLKTFLISYSSDPSLDPTSPAVENLAAEMLPAELRYSGVTQNFGPTLACQCPPSALPPVQVSIRAQPAWLRFQVLGGLLGPPTHNSALTCPGCSPIGVFPLQDPSSGHKLGPIHLAPVATKSPMPQPCLNRALTPQGTALSSV